MSARTSSAGRNVERLTAQLWSRVTRPAPERPAPEKIEYRVKELSEYEAFVSQLNENQLKALDNWGPYQPRYGLNEWQMAQVPVYGKSGKLWHIIFIRHARNPDEIQVRLRQGTSRDLCFHATIPDPTSYIRSLNARRPWLAASAFLTMLQADDAWVERVAG